MLEGLKAHISVQPNSKFKRHEALWVHFPYATVVSSSDFGNCMNKSRQVLNFCAKVSL